MMGWLISLALLIVGWVLHEPATLIAAGLFAIAGAIDYHK